MHASRIAAVVGGLALGALAATGAQAAVISVVSNATLGTVPFVATFGGGAGSLSFTAATVTGVGPGAAVATGGNAQVATVFGEIGDYQIDTVFDGSATYAALSSPTVIPNSAANDFIGFTYSGADGTHYGYAEVFGPSLVGYAYESTANTNITAASLMSTAVPEPASMTLLLGGVAGVILARRRKNSLKA